MHQGKNLPHDVAMRDSDAAYLRPFAAAQRAGVARKI